MDRVRLAAVQYLNTTPLIDGLEFCEDLSIEPTVPSRIAELLITGWAQLGLASIIDGARRTEDLCMLPAGQIGCDGPTLTVRLFSSVPFEQVDSFAADTDSHTSVVLARVLLKRLYGADAIPTPFHAREQMMTTPGAPAGAALDRAWPRSLLLIGDKVVTDPPPSDRYPHQLDLGQAWREWTGLPFVYATWMCRRDALESMDGRRRVVHAVTILDRQRRRNAMRMRWIVERSAKRSRWPEPLASEYLTKLLRYQTGPRERDGVERFFSEAASLGLCAASRPLWRELD